MFTCHRLIRVLTSGLFWDNDRWNFRENHADASIVARLGFVFRSPTQMADFHRFVADRVAYEADVIVNSDGTYGVDVVKEGLRYRAGAFSGVEYAEALREMLRTNDRPRVTYEWQEVAQETDKVRSFELAFERVQA